MSLRALQMRLQNKDKPVATPEASTGPTSSTTSDAGSRVDMEQAPAASQSELMNRNASVTSTELPEPHICEKVFTMVLLQAGLFGCVFSLVAHASYAGLFWVLLSMASFLLVVQVLYMLFFKMRDTDTQSHIVAIFIAPTVVFVATYIFSFGIMELFVQTLRDDQVHQHGWTSAEVGLFSARGSLFFLTIVLSWSLFISLVGSIAKSFGPSLLEVCIPWDVFDSDNEDDGVELANRSHPRSDTPHGSAVPVDPIGFTGGKLTYVLLVLQMAIVGLQVPAGYMGTFRAAFLCAFGLGCFVLSLLLCYTLLLRQQIANSRLNVQSNLSRVWAALPLIILLVNSWCFGAQFVEFILESYDVGSYHDVLAKMSANRMLVFVLMVVFYSFLVLVGSFITVTHLSFLLPAATRTNASA